MPAVMYIHEESVPDEASCKDKVNRHHLFYDLSLALFYINTSALMDLNHSRPHIVIVHCGFKASDAWGNWNPLSHNDHFPFSYLSVEET